MLCVDELSSNRVLSFPWASCGGQRGFSSVLVRCPSDVTETERRQGSTKLLPLSMQRCCSCIHNTTRDDASRLNETIDWGGFRTSRVRLDDSEIRTTVVGSSNLPQTVMCEMRSAWSLPDPSAIDSSRNGQPTVQSLCHTQQFGKCLAGL